MKIKQNDVQLVEEFVLSMEGGPYQEYFYVELPISINESNNSIKYKRFVYVLEENTPVKFPMQFGIELVAEILGTPERGHWKNCVLSELAEQKLADDFKNLFEKFDFTLVQLVSVVLVINQ